MRFENNLLMILILLVSIFNINADSDLTTPIQSASEYDYPPFCIVNPDSTAGGFSVELLDAACSIMGLSVDFKVGEWNTIKQELADGKLDVLPLVGRTPVREPYYDFTFPYFTFHGAIFARLDDDRINTFRDLKDMTIMVLKGDNYEEFLIGENLSQNIIGVESYAIAFRSLSEGKCDAVISQKVMGLNLINDLNIKNVEPLKIELNNFDQKFCFAVKKGNSELLSLLNEGLSVLMANGTFNKLHQKWFSQKIELAKTKLVIGCDYNYPPYEYIDEKGNPAGYNIDLSKAIAKELGIFVEFKMGIWSDIVNSLKKGEIDAIAGLFYTTARDELFDFSPSHLSSSHTIITRNSEKKYKNIQDLKGASIVVIESDIMHDYLLSKGFDKEINLVKSLEEALIQLSEGKYDCAIIAKIPAYFSIKELKLKNLVISDESYFPQEYCFAVKKGNDMILRNISDALYSLQSSGEYREIYNKWFGDYNHNQINYNFIIKIAVVIFFFILIIIFGILFWNKKLKQQVAQKTADLTEEIEKRKNTEVQLLKNELLTKASEERFRNAITYAPYPIMIHSEGQVIQLSEEWTHQTGYTIEDIPTTKIWSSKAYGKEAILSNEYIEKLYNLDKVQHDGEWNIKIKNGESLLWDFSSSPIGKLPTGEKMIITMASDITERKKSELALAAEKEQLAVTLRSIGDGVITTDTKGIIIMLNKAAEELTGWSSDDAIGRLLPEVFNIINLNTRERCENPVEKVLTSGDIIELEDFNYLISKDGKEIVVADSGAPIHDKNSDIIGVVLVFRDMTEKQKLEDSIQRTQKLESLGLLAGGIAHDFNNLLSVIFGYIEMAVNFPQDINVTAYLSESLSHIDRARALTQQLLTFAKGGAPIKKVGNLFPFVQEAIQFSLSGSSISTLFDIEDNLLPCNFDKNQIGQVLDNLIINAQQSMPNGGTIEVIARNISISDKEHCSISAGNYVKISIKDQGVGIPKKFLPNIFDPYFTTKPIGHGLGLATCYSIVSKHGGSIDVESSPGKGSTFHINLPVSTESILPLAGKSTIVHKRSGTFLVMDDEKDLGSLMKAMLESFGYKVVLKDNGKDAVDFFMAENKAGRKLAGMIFDLTIPGGMGGKEAIKEIRKVCKDTPVFVASGYSVDPIMAEPQKYGFNASLSKPFGLNDLSEMLEND